VPLQGRYITFASIWTHVVREVIVLQVNVLMKTLRAAHHARWSAHLANLHAT